MPRHSAIPPAPGKRLLRLKVSSAWGCGQGFPERPVSLGVALSLARSRKASTFLPPHWAPLPIHAFFVESSGSGGGGGQGLPQRTLRPAPFQTSTGHDRSRGEGSLRLERKPDGGQLTAEGRRWPDPAGRLTPSPRPKSGKASGGALLSVLHTGCRL